MDEIALALARARQLDELPPPTARRKLRERRGVSQAAIARAVGATSAAVSRWESGDRTPRGDFLSAYLTVLARLADEGLR